MNIDLPNMSKKEIALLNAIWNCESLGDLAGLKQNLSLADQKLVDELVVALAAELEMQQQESFAEANKLIQKIKAKLK